MSVGTCLQQAGKTGVPRDIVFKTKPQLAMQQIEAALEAAHPRGVVLADAAYGDETAWRERLAGHGLTYAGGHTSGHDGLVGGLTRPWTTRPGLAHEAGQTRGSSAMLITNRLRWRQWRVSWRDRRGGV